MPKGNPGIQTDYVVDIMTDVDVAQDDHASDDMAFQLVDIHAFVKLFRQNHPHSHVDPAVFWHGLFGNDPTGNPAKCNTNVSYLTLDSCQMILQHHQLFHSGIDFQNLPAGFFLTRNPQGGLRNVVHYSHYLATHNPKKNPLAIILSSKEPAKNQPPIEPHGFLPPQSNWYEFLENHIDTGGVKYCTEKELRNAFITFSNTVNRMGLKFFVPNFTSFDEHFNPVILLGRLNTLLTQPNLKKTDLDAQWQALPQLYLTKGYSALRAITDYDNTERPCGFILPDMYKPGKNEFHFIQTIDNPKRIHGIDSNQDFWRYLSFQPQRNSIDYYQQGLQKIQAMHIDDYKKIEIRQILAASTSGRSHSAETPEEEAHELKIWFALCDLIDNITSVTVTMQMVASIFGSEQITNNFILHLNRLEELPNIHFLHSMADCIKENLESLNMIKASADMAIGRDPLQDLVDLSNKLDSLIRSYHTDFYDGARFYFVAGKWNKLNVKTYVELQYDLEGINRKSAALLLPHLSTFDIDNLADGTEILYLLSSISQDRLKDIKYALTVFRDAINQLDKTALSKLITAIGAGLPTGNSYMSIIDYIDNNLSNAFPPNYFENKRKALIDAQYGLNEEQIQHVHDLNLTSDQTKAIISIESALVRKNNQVSIQQLDQLNELFVRLSRIITEADFTEFTRRLETVRENLSGSPETLSKLLTLLIQQKNLESFNQIFFRNKIEKCPDDSLIDKFNLYIETIKALGKQQGTISSQNIQDLLSMIVLNCSRASLKQHGFLDEISILLQSLKTVSEDHPHIQQHFLEAFNNLPGKNTDYYFWNLTNFINCINSMDNILKAGEDADAQKNMLLFFTTMANLNQKPMQLVDLWNKITTLNHEEQKKFLLSLVNHFIEKNLSLTGLDDLIDNIKKTPDTWIMLQKHCVHPPYPELKTMNKWLSGKIFEERYLAFSMRPYGKRHPEFSFNRKQFDVQMAKFEGQDASLFTSELADRLDKQTRANRNRSILELRDNFAELKALKTALNNEQKENLLCLCIEMLARTTSQWDQGTPPQRISQELNTTQLMALFAMLTNPQNKLISEIDTGEGKSRIMMILAACQVAQGKTVDFMTSDMQLAERDYLTYNAFFSALDIRSSLISLNTPKQLYQKGGVNFSDNGQLLLLRNKSDINLDPFAFLDEKEEQRCLLIDEVDKFKHDKSHDSYNYATRSKKLKGFIWIYPQLVNFVREKLEQTPEEPFDADKLTDKFVDYIAIHDMDELHKASVASLNNDKRHRSQLVTWLNAAHTALQMKEDNDYKVTDSADAKLFSVRDADGYIRYTRKVMVLDNGRPVEGSTFSAGVHQCLCAIENQKAGHDAFVIPAENVTQRASYPVSFMAKYEQGNIFGVSGTTRREAPASSDEINYENYQYLRVPRQKTLQREDKNVWAAKDDVQQIAFLKRIMLEKLKQDPQLPILLVCKNDQQSKEIHDALMADVELLALLKKTTRVHGLTEKDDEVTAIEEAGIPGHLTISTAGMFSRGVDINAKELLVLCSYVPTIEDEIQIKGRTGRFGKPGEYRMIPNLTDPDSPLNGQTYNINNEIDKLQKRMALQSVHYEEISKLYADFLENIHQIFLSSLGKKDKLAQLKHLETWQTYLNDLQKDWDNQKHTLLEAIEGGDKNQFVALCNKFTKKWEKSAARFIKDMTLPETPTLEAKANTVYAALQKQHGFFEPKRQAIKVQRRYDPSDDGQARIYSSLFAQELAVLRGERAFFADYYAWKEGRGDLFPDLMATLRGERPLFANLRATIARWIEELTAWFNQQETPDEQEDEVSIDEPSDDFDFFAEGEEDDVDADEDSAIDYGSGSLSF